MFGCYNRGMNRIPHAAELAESASPAERRTTPRAEVDGRYSTQLDLCDGREPITCVVLDYSVTGMRIEVPDGQALPERLQVLIGTLSHNGRVVWRKDNTAGVDFVDEHHSIF
jgi:hypothetical protein